MGEASALKEKLLSIELCIDNEYLDKYVDLVISNRNTTKEKFKTDYHHIIPRYYYRHTGSELDDTSDNKVVLHIKDHILAHYYLALCSSNDIYKASNVLSVLFSCNKNRKFEDIDEDWIEQNILEFETLYESARKYISSVDRSGEKNAFYGKHHTDETKAKISKAKTNPSEEVRKHLSEAQKKIDHSRNVELMRMATTGKPRPQEIKDKISQTKRASGKGNNLKGKVRITNGEINKYVYESELEYWNNLGWHRNSTEYLRKLKNELK